MIAAFSTPQYDQAIADSFKKHGWFVDKVKEDQVFGKRSILNRIERKIKIGPQVVWLWVLIIKKLFFNKYNVIYFRLCLYYPKYLIRLIKYLNPKAVLICYMNDNPFESTQQSKHFKYYINNVTLFDINYIFRTRNFLHLEKLGSKLNKLHLPYYCNLLHYYDESNNISNENPSTNILFLGHAENDMRLDCFDFLLENKINLKLGGGNFHQHSKERLFSMLLPVKYFYNEDYRKEISNSLCTLCFFSSLNHDVITTRVFEIIACGGLLVCQRKGFVETIFKEGEEALYFSTKDELLEKILFLKNNPKARKKIIIAGRKKLYSTRNEVNDRVKMIISDVGYLSSSKNNK